MSKKCSHCSRLRKPCVAVEPAVFPALSVAVPAREAHARAVRDDDDDIEERAQAARDAGDALVEDLRRFDRNRNKVAGDRPTPRKVRAAAAPAASNDALLLEVQSLRRSVLALVEVGKAVSIFLVFPLSHAPRMLTAFAARP